MMKLKHILLLPLLTVPVWGSAQCNTSNATSCLCLDSTSTDCDLLPDITISWYCTANYYSGPTEFPQTGAGADNGRLRISTGTPNIGHGPLTVGSVSMWVCGTDTFTVYPGTCPGGTDPQQLIRQRIYHKNGTVMTNYTRWAGTMTYHPTHGHMHVDDWAIFTLRKEDTTLADPRDWPIVGEGSKLGFCLMDYGECSYYYAHCRDSNDNIMVNSDFENWGLGGGSYGCSPVEQGISVGYEDIYDEYLDGMWINIPPGTCNGDYYIVAEVDPNDNFIEEREDNNWFAIPFTLTEQVPSGSAYAALDLSTDPFLCSGEVLTMSAPVDAVSYLWNTGDTTQTLVTSTPGTYYCMVTGPCGMDTSDVITVTTSSIDPSVGPAAVGDSVCEGNIATLTASGPGLLTWYDVASGGMNIGTGTSYTTPALTSTTSYWVESTEGGTPLAGNLGPADNSIGSGGNHNDASRYLAFDAFADFTLKSVWVDANGTASRTIELRDDVGTVLETATVTIPDGQSRVTLNFDVPAGTDYRLGVGGPPNLFRNDGGVSYPYSLAGIGSITGSSTTPSFYYYFYDWEVETTPKVCSSLRTEVQAVVSVAPSVSFSGLAGAYVVTDPTATLTGTPSGGTFSGPGVSGNTFSPAAAGVGGPYTITYTWTDPATGCTGTSTLTTSVGAVGVVDSKNSDARPVVYPNPVTRGAAQDQFHIVFELQNRQDVRVRISDVNGKRLSQTDFTKAPGLFHHSFSVSTFQPGVYLVEISVGKKSWTEKLVIQ